MTKRAVAVIIKDNKILIIRRIKDGLEYFVFPGGSVEKGESVKEAVIREMKEELSLDIKIDRFLFKIFVTANEYDSGRMSYFYLVKKFRGTPKLGGPEKERMNKNNQYYPEWKSLNQLKELTNLYPEEAKTKFIAFYNNENS